MPLDDPKQTESSRLWRLSGMGSELAFGVIGMALLGWLLDRWLHSTPWIMLSCAMIGLIGGGWNFLRRALAAQRASSEQWKAEHPHGVKKPNKASKQRGGKKGIKASRQQGIEQEEGPGSSAGSGGRARGVADSEEDPYR